MTSVAVSEPVQRVRGVPAALEAADRLARRWRKSGGQCDRDRRLPMEQLAELRRSGLLAISVPQAFGGPGLAPSVVARVFATLAEADLALAQIGQNHFDFVDVLRFAEEPFRSDMFAQVLDGARFGNALAERGVKDMKMLKTKLVPRGKGFLLSGTKHFATGALTADWIPVTAVDPHGELRVAYVEQGAPGVELLEDWDAFGQRATFSGTAIFAHVQLSAQQVVERGRGDHALAVALLAGNQLIHAAIEYGGARAALASIGSQARGAKLADAVELSRLAVARASGFVDAAVLAHPEARVDAAIRAMLAVDAAKVIAYRVGPLLGRAVFAGRDLHRVQSGLGLDRHWRNSRVHSLHDPANLRERGLGSYVLCGSPPAMAAGLLARE